MEPEDLYLKHDKVFIMKHNVSVEVDYDTVEIGTPYFIVTKTKNFSIYKKTETFDDEFTKLEEEKGKAEEFLKKNS